MASLNVDAKIRRSSKINEGRMAKMNTRYELTQRLKSDLRESLKKRIQDETIYKALLKTLIVQVSRVLLRVS
jgi:V-type H+-transporting ATPase subunit E